MCLRFGAFLTILFASKYLLCNFSFASQGILSFLLDTFFASKASRRGFSREGQLIFVYIQNFIICTQQDPLTDRRSTASPFHSCIASSSKAVVLLRSFLPFRSVVLPSAGASISSSFTVSWVSDVGRGGWVVAAFPSSKTRTRVGGGDAIRAVVAIPGLIGGVFDNSQWMVFF